MCTVITKCISHNTTRIVQHNTDTEKEGYGFVQKDALAFRTRLFSDPRLISLQQGKVDRFTKEKQLKELE